jgi:hypothetical protein
MESPTSHYQDLFASLSQAARLVNSIKGECKTELQNLKRKAYILICHSAFENYLEGIGRSAAMESLRIYKTDSTITKTLVALISSKILNDVTDNKSKTKLSSDLVSNIEIFSREANNLYYSIIESNNGIKKKDQKMLLLPVGVDPESTDVELMNNLDRFGDLRNEEAHHFKAKREIFLSEVRSLITNISASIKAYDVSVCHALTLRMSVKNDDTP